MVAGDAQTQRGRFGWMRVLGLVTLAIAGVAATGCTADNASNAKDGSTANNVPELPAFTSPGSIKPSDASLSPHVQAPAVADATPSTPSAGKATGPWAPPVAPRPWRYIVLHHSASPSGNAALFDREHRDKGWDELGYHFVIDNGQGGPDGRIEIGPRWEKQKWGAHAKTPDEKYNNFGIGICFVGNFEQTRPTAKQLASAARLVAWLEQTYKIPADNVIGHEDTGKQTLCPGRNLHVVQVRSLADHQIQLAQAGESLGEDPITSIFDPSSALAPLHARVAAAPTQVELLQAR